MGGANAADAERTVFCKTYCIILPAERRAQRKDVLLWHVLIFMTLM